MREMLATALFVMVVLLVFWPEKSGQIYRKAYNEFVTGWESVK